MGVVSENMASALDPTEGQRLAILVYNYNTTQYKKSRRHNNKYKWTESGSEILTQFWSFRVPVTDIERTVGCSILRSRRERNGVDSRSSRYTLRRSSTLSSACLIGSKTWTCDMRGGLREEGPPMLKLCSTTVRITIRCGDPSCDVCRLHSEQ